MRLALRFLSKLGVTAPSYAETLDRGLAALASRQFAKANRLLIKAHNLRPVESQATANRALALLGLGDLAGADHIASCVLNTPTADKNSNLTLAQALEQMGRFQDAARCVAKAYATDPTEFSLLELVGRLYWKGGAHQLANDAWAQWAALDKNNALAHEASEARFLGIPWVGWIGNLCHLEIYQKARMLGLMAPHRAVISAPADRVSNHCLLDYWRNYFEVQLEGTESAVSNAEFRRQVPIHTLQLKDSCMYLYDLQARVERLWAEQNRPPLMQITPDHAARGKIATTRMGIPPDAWFVCLHIREQGFWQEGGNKFHLPRCADIRHYDQAIQAVIDAGGYVVRLGDPAMSRIPQRAGLIDYAHAEEKSDWLDVYLAGACRFMLASNSGMIWLAKLFGRPVIGTDWLPMGPLPPSRKDLFVPKRLYSATSQRFLTFSEMLEGDLTYEWSGNLYDRLGLSVHDAEPLVLAEAVEQMLEETESEDEVFKTSSPESPGLQQVSAESSYKVNCRLATGFKKRNPDFVG